MLDYSKHRSINATSLLLKVSEIHSMELKPLNFFSVLVDLLMKEHNLISRLKSVKRFFLLDQGDFLNQFIDLADDELKMPVSDITSSRLEALLEISIRTSAADKDPYKDDLKVVLSDKDLITQERYELYYIMNDIMLTRVSDCL